MILEIVAEERARARNAPCPVSARDSRCGAQYWVCCQLSRIVYNGVPPRRALVFQLLLQMVAKENLYGDANRFALR